MVVSPLFDSEDFAISISCNVESMCWDGGCIPSRQAPKGGGSKGVSLEMASRKSASLICLALIEFPCQSRCSGFM